MARTRPTHFLPVVLLLAAVLASCGGADPRADTGTLEDQLTYPVSLIVIQQDESSPTAMLDKVIQALEDLDSGTPFGEVAKRRSDIREGNDGDGWLGFLRMQDKDSLAGAVQAVRPGSWGGPIETEKGAHFVFRHTFDEARRREEREYIPAYGFFVPWGTQENPGPSKAEAEAKAKEAWEKVSKGELTLAEASQRYSPVPVRRPDMFIANVRDSGPQKPVYAAVQKAAPGELAPLAELPEAFLVVRRGNFYRSHIRHILIQHLESANRPLAVSRTRVDAKALAEKIIAELGGDTSKWADAHRRYSDELRSAALHGWIGALTNGDLMPVMEEAIEATPPGQIADKVVETQEGYHVLYRVN